MSHFAVTVLGVDRPGIVAAVTGVLTDQGCNLEDTSMTILRGHFAMMLVVAAGDRSASDLESALAAVAADLDLVVVVRPVREVTGAARSTEGDWTVAVYGADRPGIVSRVAGLLAGHGANIVDLSTRVIGAADQPVYAMVLEVSLPGGSEVGSLTDGLQALAAELGVSCSLHPSEADIL